METTICDKTRCLFCPKMGDCPNLADREEKNYFEMRKVYAKNRDLDPNAFDLEQEEDFQEWMRHCDIIAQHGAKFNRIYEAVVLTYEGLKSRELGGIVDVMNELKLEIDN